MKKTGIRVSFAILLTVFCMFSYAQKDIFEIKAFRFNSDSQMTATDTYLRDSYLPTLHHLGFKNIGVFKPLANDTAAVKMIYVITSYKSLDVWRKTKLSIESNLVNENASKAFTDADTSNLAYQRIQSTILEAFPDQEKLIPSPVKTNPDAVYEMRSYESPTDELHRIKVDMFNAGGEIKIFKSLDCNAVFYGEVLSGPRMPNFIYMLSFTSVGEQKAHWKAFGENKTWKKISTDPKYRNDISVSHIESITMRRTAYSDL